MKISNPTLRSVKRARWAWLMAVILGAVYYVSPINSELQLISHKLLTGTLGYIVAHILTKSFYDYASVSKFLEEDKFNEIPDGIKFVGVCIIRGLPEAAFIIGAMLGI